MRRQQQLGLRLHPFERVSPRWKAKIGVFNIKGIRLSFLQCYQLEPSGPVKG